MSQILKFCWICVCGGEGGGPGGIDSNPLLPLQIIYYYVFKYSYYCVHFSQGILYQEYSDSRKQWEEEREKLVSSKSELAALREGDRIRLEELAKLHESLSSEDDSQRKRLIEMSRRVTLLQVNEKTLSRRYTLIAESEVALRKVRACDRNTFILNSLKCSDLRIEVHMHNL